LVTSRQRRLQEKDSQNPAMKKAMSIAWQFSKIRHLAHSQ
jgi:hypothetical protein